MNRITIGAIVLILIGMGTYVYKLEQTPVDQSPIPPIAARCFVGGCSGQICSEERDIASTCEWREEYACYRSATCERQKDGQCGWTDTASLRMCLDNAI